MAVPTPVPQGTQSQQTERIMKFISGALTKIPEVKITHSGSPVADLNLAIDTPKGTFYIKVTVWGTAAYYVINLKKGDKVSAFGQYVKREFDKQDGTKGISHELQYASVYLDYGYILESVAIMVNQMVGIQPESNPVQAPQTSKPSIDIEYEKLPDDTDFPFF